MNNYSRFDNVFPAKKVPASKEVNAILSLPSFHFSEKPSVSLFLRQHLLLITPLAARRTFHVSCPANMRSKICLPVCRYVSVMAFLTFIVSDFLLDTLAGQATGRHSLQRKAAGTSLMVPAVVF